MELRCVKCSQRVERLYIQYSPGNIRLVKCDNCKSVADEYIECELMILIIDLILHRPKAYRHLLFNVIHRSIMDFNDLLFKSSLIFLLIDAYKIWILSGNSKEWLTLSFGLKILLSSLLGNLVFLSVVSVLSKRLLELLQGCCGYNDLLLAIIVSSYLKVYILAMVVWDFPTSVVYIIDLFVMSSNLVALKVITESSLRRCAGVCLGAHAVKLSLNWMLMELTL